MARKAEANGVKATLERLFGHDDDRSLLAKLGGRAPLKAHRSDPKKRSNVFRRTLACDNLIKNLLALDAVFDSQVFACELALGQVPAARLRQEVRGAKARLEKKLLAYGYWAARLDSLEALLLEQPSLEDVALEDQLVISGPGSEAGEATPYALRAIRLLEKVEEHGRRTLLGPAQLNEKAWALYRVGLFDQAVQVARSVVAVDPEHAEAWMLLAIRSIEQKRLSDREVAYYELQKEEADATSSHERWAIEMREMAESRRAEALDNHRSIVFPALNCWPRDNENSYRRYRYRDSYEQIRNWCIDWLFGMTAPEAKCLSTGVDWLRNQEAGDTPSGLSWHKDPVAHHARWALGAGTAQRLSTLEVHVATHICREWQEQVVGHMHFAFFQRDLLEISRPFIPMKLLHVHSVLGLPGYGEMRKHFLDSLRHLRTEDLSIILRQPALLHTLTLHCGEAGTDEMLGQFHAVVDNVRKDHLETFVSFKCNLLRRAYHHAFARSEFAMCLTVACEAQGVIEAAQGYEPPELGMDEYQSNTLSAKHWKYLELRAAVEIGRDCGQARQALLSVEEPAVYFSDETTFLIQEIEDLEFGEDYHVAPYGESILTDGSWLEAVQELLDSGAFTEDGTLRCAQALVEQLIPLQSQPPAY